LRKNLALLAISLLFAFLLLLAGEMYCRFFTSINFLGISSGLFVPGRYGTSYGNAPNFTGIAFGEKFSTDENGFRADPQLTSPPTGKPPALLIAGDSVSFGPGVPEEMTIAGRLRRMMPGMTVYNASAIGYDAFDYKNAVDAVIARKGEIRTVLLFYCLNDLSDVSARRIRTKTSAVQDPDHRENASPVEALNDYLRSRSRLYLFLKTALRDPSLTHFRYDLGPYQQDEKNLRAGLQPLADIQRQLAARGVAFQIYILPYEAQLRPGSPPAFLLPQKRVADFLRGQGIDFTDATAEFQREGAGAQSLFLYGDPMHLSKKGHQMVARLVCGRLPDCPKR
jgi:hypothetical protein